MAVDAPSHLIPFSPPKIRRAKVDLYLVRTLKADRGVHVMAHARHVDPHKRVWQANAVVREEERAGAELVPAADDDALFPTRNLKMSAGESSAWRVYPVVPTAVGIFEELAQIVQVQGRAETVPPGQTPRRIWFACRTYLEFNVESLSWRRSW
jgi:hypothetical protein